MDENEKAFLDEVERFAKYGYNLKQHEGGDFLLFAGEDNIITSFAIDEIVRVFNARFNSVSVQGGRIRALFARRR